MQKKTKVKSNTRKLIAFIAICLVIIFVITNIGKLKKVETKAVSNRLSTQMIMNAIEEGTLKEEEITDENTAVFEDNTNNLISIEKYNRN